MTKFNKQQIQNQIQNIISNINFADNSTVQNRSSEIIIKNNNLTFSLDITGIELPIAEEVKNNTIKQLQNINDINKINIILTSHRSHDNHTNDSDTNNNSDSNSQTKHNPNPEKAKIHIEGVKKIILIAAGKGGVGKSTISALLAHKLKSEGKRIGIIDADIYGPSIPHMFNLNGRPKIENNRMIPLQNYGIFVNSIGFITDPSSSISWRGPMTSKAIYQLLSLTSWGNLDYLIIDTPPGTGDIHLSILQNYIIDHVLMVTTPQKISELDVARAINLYNKFDIPIIGIIENMSYYIDLQTKQNISLFSGNSGQHIAEKYRIPLLTKLPLKPELSADCDSGRNLNKYIKLLNPVIL